MFWHFESVYNCSKGIHVFLCYHVVYVVLCRSTTNLLLSHFLFSFCSPYVILLRIVLLIPLKYHTGNRSCRLLQYNIITTKTYRLIIFHCRGERSLAAWWVCDSVKFGTPCQRRSVWLKIVPSRNMPVLICPREKLWTRTYSVGDLVPTCSVFTRAKIKSRFGILVNLPSQYIYMCVCVSIYIYMCVCVSIYACVCAWVYIYVCVSVYICVCACIYMCVCEWIYMCVCVCEWIYMCVCVSVYICVCECIYICVCVRVSIYVCVCVSIYMCVCVCKYICVCVCRYIYVYVCVCEYIYVCVCVCVCVSIYIYIYMCVCVCVLSNLNDTVVRMDSVLPSIFNYSNPFFNSLETVPSAPTIIRITINGRFQKVFSSLAKYFFHLFPSFYFHSVARWNDKIQ